MNAEEWTIEASWSNLEALFTRSGYTPAQSAQIIKQWKAILTPKTEGK